MRGAGRTTYDLVRTPPQPAANRTLGNGANNRRWIRSVVQVAVACVGQMRALRLPHLARLGRECGESVARVDNARRPIEKLLVIYRGVVGGDKRYIKGADNVLLPLNWL